MSLVVFVTSSKRTTSTKRLVNHVNDITPHMAPVKNISGLISGFTLTKRFANASLLAGNAHLKLQCFVYDTCTQRDNATEDFMASLTAA